MSDAVQAISQQSFETAVLQAPTPVVADFWAPWCGPCRMVAPELEKVATRMGERAKVVKINVDDSPALASQYGVMSIPTLLIFHQGQEIGRHVGFVTAENLVQALERYLTP